MTAMMHIISLGAGVQSSTMALMAALGEITPMPDAAIFADTGWEPKAVYEHLAWLTPLLPFPVHIVSGGNLKAALIAGGSRRSKDFYTVPFFTTDGGMGRRQCTSHYKVEPIRRKTRELLGRPKGPVPKNSASKWIGISLDEAVRMKPSGVQFEVKRWPLVELRVSRRDCLAGLTRHGYPIPPKSACLGCPYHSQEQWRDLKRSAEWEETVAVERAIREGVGGRQQFMHPQRVPLDQVDLSTAEDRGQLNLFLNECEGMCGV